MKSRIIELEAECDWKDAIIKNLKETISSYNQQIQVQRYREDLEIAHIIPRLRLCLQVFENNLHEYLFESKTTMTKDEFLAALIDKLNIEKNEDAWLLANYFIPKKEESINTWRILDKIIYISGAYRSFKDSDFIKLKDTFDDTDENRKQIFIKRLRMLTENKKADCITSNNFALFLQVTDIDFDIRAFIVLLLRKSQSIGVISLFALRQVMYEILGYGERPEKVQTPTFEWNDEIPQSKFVDNIKRIMIIHKAAQAFKAIRSKNKTKIRTVKTNKSLVMKELKKGIHSAIQRFIRGDPLSDEEDEPIENCEAPR